MLENYLAAEQQVGRISADADLATTALMLIGSGHLVFAARPGAADEFGQAEVEKVVAQVVAGVLTR